MTLIIILIIFLFGLVVIVAAFAYLLLSQEETKVPKTIDDQVLREIHKKRYRHLEPYLKAGKSIESGLGRFLGRFLDVFFTTQSLLLYITFGVALVITLIAVSIIRFDIAAVIYFPFLVIALPLFPIGLIEFLYQTLHHSPTSTLAMDFEILAGWLIYMIVFIFHTWGICQKAVTFHSSLSFLYHVTDDEHCWMHPRCIPLLSGWLLKCADMLVPFEQRVMRHSKPPNKACTRLGVRTAFFEHFLGFRFFPFRRRIHAPTPSG